MHAQAAYDELIRRTREESLLASCAELLGWDELTYMPRGGVAHRAEQMALLAGMLHERGTDPRLGELLDVLEGSDLIVDPDSPAAVNVREIRRVYDRQTRLPRTLVEETARVTSVAQGEWEIARADADFARLRPWLEKVVALKRREGELLGRGATVYDALLNDYEPGAASAEIARLFEALRIDLMPLVDALTNAPRRPGRDVLRRAFPLERQRLLGAEVAAAVGFDFQRGRLDTAVHPFCSSIGPGDCRITTRFHPHNFSDAFFAVLHEVGHGLYEQGLDPAHYGTPAGEVSSLGLHESQSRLWENQVGRGRPFWDHFYPRTRQMFPEALADVGPDEFYFAVNRVEPSTNRVRADEVTYNLHILVRFELEQALMERELPVADLPAAWNEAYRRYLGVTPADDAEGCLQDGHWASGQIGYFPTYTLGNLFAAQLFARAAVDLDDLDACLRRGDFTSLLGWLGEHVYRPGGLYPAARLIERATGSPPDHRPLISALRHKYGELYEL
jgi:carboxypeptidase Taq